jgi:hypothetical protein
MASVDYDPAYERTRPWWSRLILPLAAFLLGLLAMGWLLMRWESAAMFLGVAPEPPPAAAAPAPAPSPQPATKAEPALPPPAAGEQRFVIDPETQRRVARLEQRLAELDNASRAAVGNADRAEGLLVAFAARRALDRGVALGYIEHLLRQRFGQNQPQAVGMVITAARQPVTLQELQRELEELGPRLGSGGPEQSWWDGFRAELGSLITIRREGTQSTIPSERLRRAYSHMQAGEVNYALVEVMRMPGAGQASDWIAKARRYVSARAALDAIETAALLDPAPQPRPQQPAQPQAAQPARPAAPTPAAR